MALFTRLSLAAALTFSSLPASALDQKDRPEIEKIVREYLVSHPEVLFEAQEEWNKRQQAKVEARRSDALGKYLGEIDKAKLAAVIGNPQGDVTLVEFFDYNCGYCRAAVRDIDQLVAEDPKLRVILMELPVIRQESLGAATVSLAVNRTAPEKFRAFHDKLFAINSIKTKDRAIAVAKDVGVDQAAVEAAMSGPQIEQALLQSKNLADDLGVEATPTFVIGDAVVPNTTSIVDDLKGRIAALRKCGKAIC